MPIDRQTIVHVADLARIALTEDEITRFTGQLSVVLDAVVIVPTVRPAPVIDVVASACVWPTTLGTEISAGADTGRLTMAATDGTPALLMRNSM